MDNPQVVYSWRAPLRPYIKRGKNILRFYIAVALLISAIVFFLGDKILLIPIWTLLFLFYVLTITPPPEVENKITQFGVETTGVTLRWEALSHFYFAHRLGYDILTLVTHPPYFYHAYLVVPNEEARKKIISLLSPHIVYQDKPRKTLVDKMADWLSKLVVEEAGEVRHARDSVQKSEEPSP
jgi:hypothetical protein